MYNAMKSLASQGIEKIYQVKQYDEFPFKKNSDPLIKEYETLREAKRGLYLCRKFDVDDARYYLIDEPHQKVEATEQQENALDRLKRLCGIL